ncbi:cytochrome P450, partial [Flammula alnicola]
PNDTNDSLIDSILLLLALGVVFVWWRHTVFQSRRRPLLGNLLDMPRFHPWNTFLEWKKHYGDVVYVDVLGNGILILNTMEAVNDLLVKRAGVYSDRPTFVMLGELIGVDNSIPLLQYGPTLRQHRKLCHSALGQESVKKYYTAQEDAAAMFIDSLLEQPNEFAAQLRMTAGRIIMSVIYGIPVTTPDDIYITEAEELMEIVSKASVPGAYLVDLVPMLKHLPSWLPFNTIHKTAEHGRKLLYSVISQPYQHVKREMAEGVARPSFTAECLQAYESEAGGIDEDAEHLIRWAAGAMYAHICIDLTFIYAMALYPDVQRKIQAEIDSIVGRRRMPSIQDRPELPYTCAAVKETMRWRPAAPLGVARRTSADDYYRVLPNIWAISTDETSGIPSGDFSPERFMTGEHAKDALDPHSYAFGFGHNNMFLLISWLMATVNISKPKDEQGIEKPLNVTYTDGLVSYPEPFEACFTPRYQEVVSLVKHRVAGID